MASYRQAFALSKQEVGEATPPGTVKLVGMFSEPTSLTKHISSM